MKKILPFLLFLPSLSLGQVIKNNAAQFPGGTIPNAVTFKSSASIVDPYFSVGGSTFVVTGGLVAVLGGSPSYPLDVTGSLRATGQGIFGSSVTIVGVTDGSGACATCVGFSTSVTLGADQVPGASTYWVALSTIVLSPGDWDIYGACDLTEGATTAGTQAACAIGNSSGGTDCFLAGCYNIQSHTLIANDEDTLVMGPRRISISAVSTYFLNASLTFTTLGGAVWKNARSGLSARRMR